MLIDRRQKIFWGVVKTWISAGSSFSPMLAITTESSFRLIYPLPSYKRIHLMLIMKVMMRVMRVICKCTQPSHHRVGSIDWILITFGDFFSGFISYPVKNLESLSHFIFSIFRVNLKTNLVWDIFIALIYYFTVFLYHVSKDI